MTKVFQSATRTLQRMLLLGLAAIPCLSAHAETSPRITLPRVAQPPKLAEYLSGKKPVGLEVREFVQREPNDGAVPTLKTRAYLSYDSRALYALFVCTQDPTTVRAHLSRREDIADDDRVSISLDTYHDKRRAYEFFSNPLGVQRDGYITEGQDDDFDFDTVWHSEGRLTADGYVVLMSIPFKSLRFNPSEDATWGIALGRFSPGNQEFSTWPHLTEKVQAYVPQFATLNALTDSSPGHNLQFIPYGTFGWQRFLNTPASGAENFQSKNEWRGGLDAKYVLRDSLTFDFTANPDFSQVESDEPQVTVNQRFEVFFPEKRPFFTEGSGFFQTPENLFFSRRIADPQFGLRMTGKVGPWALGAIAMDDRAPGQLLDPTDPLRGRRAQVAVARVQHELGKESAIGGFVSRLTFAGSSNGIVSLDTRLKLSPNWIFSGQAIRSQSRDLAHRDTSGSDFFTEIRHSGLHFSYSGSYLDRSPNFQADLGFIPRVDIRQVANTAAYRWRPETGSIVSFGPRVKTRAIWDHRGQMQEWLIDVPFSFEFKGPTSLSFGRLEEYERFQNIGFRENASYIYFTTQKLGWLGINASFVHGTNINFDPAAGLLPFLGRSDDAAFGFTLRPNSRMRLEETYLFSRLGLLAGSTPAGSAFGQSVFNNHLLRTKLSYQFTKALSLRAIVDYDAVLPSPSLVALERTKRVTSDFLVTYMVHPGTAIYFGYTDRRENLALDPNQGLLRTSSPGLGTGRQVFIKISYLFRF